MEEVKEVTSNIRSDFRLLQQRIDIHEEHDNNRFDDLKEDIRTLRRTTSNA